MFVENVSKAFMELVLELAFVHTVKIIGGRKMVRFTGAVKPGKYAKNQCKFCKRYFQSVRHHLAQGTACKQLRGEA